MSLHRSVLVSFSILLVCLTGPSDADPAQRVGAHRARTTVEIPIGSLDGTNGFSVVGTREDDELGLVGTGLGDVNGDGIDDFAVGSLATDFGGPDTGAVFVFYGRKQWAGRLTVPPAAGTGFIIGTNGGETNVGWRLARAGDFDRDGLDDIALTSKNKAFIVFGAKTRANPLVNLDALAPPQGIVLSMPAANLGDAINVSGGGDWNGDGFDDVAVGVEYYLPAGENQTAIYIVLGQSRTLAKSFTLDEGPGKRLAVAVDGARLVFGRTISEPGDVNGDRYADFAATAAFGRSINGNTLAVTHLLTGRPSTRYTLDAEDLPRFYDKDDRFTFWRPIVGDMDGDGMDELVLPQISRIDDITDQATVVMGARRYSRATDIGRMGPPRAFVLHAEASAAAFGASGSLLGDYNGDGIKDLAIGESTVTNDDGSSRGGAVVVYGRQDLGPVNVGNLRPSRGFYVNGNDDGGFTGHVTTLAGDVNGDGFDDLLVTSPFGANGRIEGAGVASVVFGWSTGPIVRTGTPANDRFAGGPFDDVLDGSGGQDRIDGREGDDVIIGGAGRDRLTGGPGNDTFLFRRTGDSSGGVTTDFILDFEPAADQIDLSAIDADATLPGNQTFRYIANAAFGGPGQIRVFRLDQAGTANDLTVVEANTDGDLAPEMRIELRGFKTLTSLNFVR